MAPMVEVCQVRKAFGQTQALRGVDLTVGEGQVVGLLGPNGAGKTTLVRILATLLAPDAGQALVAGHDVVAQAPAVRRAIGLAGQYALVDQALTGRENLEMTGRLYQLSHAEARRRAAAVLARLSLGEVADRLVRTCSGGMRRRLDLGACLVGNPKVLLLDEPTTGLDPAARREVWSYLRDLTGSGTSVLLTTQQLDEADELADNIVIINRGTVITAGTPAFLKSRLADDRVELTIAPAQAGEAQRVVAPVLAAVSAPSAPAGRLGRMAAPPHPGHPVLEVDGGAGRLTFRVPRGSAGLTAVLRSLDEAEIGVSGLTVSGPSLDDVFLAVTDKEQQ